MKHSGRAHSKYSASGAERYANCPGSVELSEGLPDKDSEWSVNGTLGHEVLEATMLKHIEKRNEEWLERRLAEISIVFKKKVLRVDNEMKRHANNTARFILDMASKYPDSEVLVENRVYLDFIDPEMFGTYDGAVVDHFGVLNVIDYKYGAGHRVIPTENLQMIFYGIGIAHKYDWNFKKVRLWIIQPRIKGYDGPVFWEVSIHQLKAYVETFREIVQKVKDEPYNFSSGAHCHWCKAKSICPLKQEDKLEKAASIFARAPLGGDYDGKDGKKENSEEGYKKGNEKSSEENFGDEEISRKEKGRGKKSSKQKTFSKEDASAFKHSSTWKTKSDEDKWQEKQDRFRDAIEDADRELHRSGKGSSFY